MLRNPCPVRIHNIRLGELGVASGLEAGFSLGASTSRCLTLVRLVEDVGYRSLISSCVSGALSSEEGWRIVWYGMVPCIVVLALRARYQKSPTNPTKILSCTVPRLCYTIIGALASLSLRWHHVTAPLSFPFPRNGLAIPVGCSHLSGFSTY